MLTSYSDPTILQSIMSEFRGKRPFLMFFHSIRNELIGNFPLSKFHLYSSKSNEATYWFGYWDNSVVKNRILVACDGKVDDNSELFASFQELCDIYNILSENHLLIGDQHLTESITEWVNSKTDGMTIHDCLCAQYHMTEEAELEMINEKETMGAVSLPEGYELGNCTPDDAGIMTSTWAYAGKGDLENNRQKIFSYPTSCVRFHGELVAFEMIDPVGFFNHQYTMKEHRNRGLGKAVETSLVRKCYDAGISNLYKTILLSKHAVIKASERSKFWTRAKNATGENVVVNFVGLDVK